MIIIQDTREKEPWSLSESQIVQTLETGDYTLHDFPFLIIIDRKKSPSELANNLGKNINRFKNELERMQDFEYRYVLCEFSYDEMLKFPHNAKIPKKLKRRIRMKGRYMGKIISELMDEFDVNFIFCDSRYDAETKALELFEEVINAC